MTTSLTFTAPIDLSIGKVSITDEQGVTREWMATPDNRVFDETVEPGFHTAEISPAGVAPQSVVFEVHADQHNDVAAPPFSSLIASSGSMTFLDASSTRRAIEAIYAGAAKGDEPSAPMVAAAPGLLGADDPDEGATVSLVSGCERAADPRQLAVDLSMEDRLDRRALRPFVGRATMELSEVRLQLIVSGSDGWSPYFGDRVRATVAVEGLGTKCFLLPMYRGGTQITVTPSTMSSNDVEFEVMPEDARLRALARALVAGTNADAVAVQDLVRSPGDFLETIPMPDPWEAILSALLSIRFPDAIPGLNLELAGSLLEFTPWAYDSHVIWARQLLFSAEDSGRPEAARSALEALSAALACGWPYFDYANQLFAEVIEVLLGYFGSDGTNRQREWATGIRERWLRDRSLQSKAGPSFSWHGLEPSDGGLGPAHLRAEQRTRLFGGQIGGGNIRIDPAQATEPAKGAPVDETPSLIDFNDAPQECPALRRGLGPENDPNLGRFGGSSGVGGYALHAAFDGGDDAEVVTISLIVETDAETVVPPDAIAWFCLHFTFVPQWIKVRFGNGRAVCSVQSLGGFTAGVWIPHAGIELESDLSALSDGPRVVRER